MLKLLKDLWNPEGIDDELELLRYRSNLLGADLRITNFGGGNTSSKIYMVDPFTGQPTSVLAVKGSGGDLGSIKTSGFALLYMDKLNQLRMSIKVSNWKMRWSRITRSAHLERAWPRHPSIRRCMHFCRSSTSTTFIRTGRSQSRQVRTEKRSSTS